MSTHKTDRKDEPVVQIPGNLLLRTASTPEEAAGSISDTDEEQLEDPLLEAFRRLCTASSGEADREGQTNQAASARLNKSVFFTKSKKKIRTN